MGCSASARPGSIGALVACLLVATPGGATDRDGGRGAPSGDGARLVTARRVSVETIAVDRRGTRSVGADEADIFPGDTGVLRKVVTLAGGRGPAAPPERVGVTARITPEVRGDGACMLRVETVARHLPSAPSGPTSVPDRRVASFVLSGPEDRLIEAYSSDVTGGRVKLRIRCAASPPGLPEALRFVDIVLSISRAEGIRGEWTPLKSNVLRAVLGREASNSFSFNVPLPEAGEGGKRYRRERLEVRIAPQVESGGRLQMDLAVDGEIATVSSLEPTVSHPVGYAETIVLARGGGHTVDLSVLSSSPAEGWSGVRYRLRVTARF
ncbi:MAG: hypothetical protein ACE5JH_02215 [Acidobacteriota bacterium]